MGNKKIFFAGILGNILDHYDTALLIYLGSIMAPLFFYSDDPNISLIMFYGVFAMSAISRPLGSFIFSKIAAQYGATHSLMISLIGTAISTFSIGLLPTVNDVGFIATILFCLLRFFQTFFGSGEHTVAVLFLIENSEPQSRARVAAFFNCSTMIGISLASLASYFVSLSTHPNIVWRIPYFIGIITAFIGIYIRLNAFSKIAKTNINQNKQTINFLQIISKNFKVIFIISILYIFSMITYYIPFGFMNDYIPKIHANISKSDLLRNNTILLYYDLLLLIFIGLFFKNINDKKIIIFASTSLSVFIIPAFYLLQIDSLLVIEIVRFVIITIGVVFLSVFQSYIFKICDPKDRYIIHGSAIVIGQDFIGRLTISISLFLCYLFQSNIAPAYYILLVSVIICISVSIYKIPLYDLNKEKTE